VTHVAQNELTGFSGREAAAALRSRGLQPSWCEANVAFAGAPVWQDSSASVVASGEALLYNAAELTGRLGLSSASDGELLAELFARHGPAGGLQARGMYAVAVYDRRDGRAYLLRDGAGCRTAYYAAGDLGTWFGTRRRTLDAMHDVRGEASLEALRDYLTYSYVPGSQTMWTGIKEVRPGTAVSLAGGCEASYWEPRENDAGGSLADHASRLRAALEDAVKAALPNKGPVGVFLSGGVDSSLVTALAARFANGPVHTYSLHFGPKYANELEFSEMVAKHCGTVHHVIEITPAMIVNHLEETMAALDDPIGDPLTVPNLMLGRRASEDVGVILNGEGGDPCFGGPKNQAMLLHVMYGDELSPEQAYLRSYRKCLTELDRLLLPEVSRKLEGSDPAALLRPFFQGPRMSSYLNRLMHINVRLKGADHILTKVNNLTRINGLLAHSPLFEREIVDLSFAAGPAMKIDGTEEKIVLKRAVADLLPEPVLTRPKSGMMVPVNGWARGELRDYVEAVLHGEEGRQGPALRRPLRRWLKPAFGNRALIWRYINPEPVREWLYARVNERQGAKLWMLISLELWLRTHGRT
jgi:asparagine synthase (glutamine-hydrolysing)